MQQGRGPSTQLPSSLTGAGGRGGGTGRPLGSHWGAESPSSSSLAPTAGAGPGKERKARAGSPPLPSQNQKVQDFRGLASKLPLTHHRIFPNPTPSFHPKARQSSGLFRPILTSRPQGAAEKQGKTPCRSQWGPRTCVSLIMNSTPGRVLSDPTDLVLRVCPLAAFNCL